MAVKGVCFDLYGTLLDYQDMKQHGPCGRQPFINPSVTMG